MDRNAHAVTWSIRRAQVWDFVLALCFNTFGVHEDLGKAIAPYKHYWYPAFTDLTVTGTLTLLVPCSHRSDSNLTIQSNAPYTYLRFLLPYM